MRTEQTQSLEEAAAIAKALAHPARVRVVLLLHEKQACIGCDIVEEVGLAQSTVSEHLRILKAAGIITGDIEGPRVCYSLNAKSLVPFANLLNEIVAKPRGSRRNSVNRLTRANTVAATRPTRRIRS